MPRFTEEDLRRRGFLQRSKDFYTKASDGAPAVGRKDSDTNERVSPTHAELIAWTAQVQASLDQESYPPRIVVRITSARGKYVDDDNLFGKYLVDRLREAGLIPEDNPKVVKLEQIKQTKMAGGYKDEGTIIEIFMEGNDGC